MSLSLTTNNRASNSYFSEIDRLNANTTTSVNILTDGFDNVDSRLTVAEDDLVIQVTNTNIDVTPVFAPSFPDDVSFYLDFSVPEYPELDVSGKKRHAKNMNKIKYQSDEIRTNTLDFYTTPNLTLNSYSDTYQHLDLSEHISSIFTASMSLAFWFKRDTIATESTLFFARNVDGSNELLIRITGTTFVIQIEFGGVIVLQMNRPVTDVWDHNVFTMGPSGAKWCRNGGPHAANYATGDATTSVDFSTYNFTKFVVGVRDGMPGNAMNWRPFIGQMSDIIGFNYVLSDNQIAEIYADNYGYDLITLAGQSNMTGADSIKVAGVDDVYTSFTNKVFAYNTHDNLNQFNGVVQNDIISPAQHPLQWIANYIPGTNTSALWYTFMIDYIKNVNMAYRRKILLLPSAKGATGFISNVAGDPGPWQKPNECYDRSVTIANEAMTNANLNGSGMNKITAFLWCQGENDISLLNVNYKAHFEAMMDNFDLDITDFDHTTIPVILSEVSASNYNTLVAGGGVNMKQKIKADMLQLVSENTNYGLVDTADLTITAGNVHYDINGVRELGRRYFKQYVDIVGKNDSRITTYKDPVVFNENVYLNPNVPTGFTNIPLSDFIQQTFTLNITGAVVGTPTMVITFIKLGKMGIMHSAGATLETTGTAGNIEIATGQIPSNLYPTHGGLFITAIANKTSGGNTVPDFLSLRFAPPGRIIFTDDANSPVNADDYLTINATYAIRQFTSCYVVA